MMTVAELMAVLATMPADAPVCFTDTYVESEGWGPMADDPVLMVCGASVDSEGRVHLDGEDPDDGEEYEDEEEDEEEEEDWD